MKKTHSTDSDHAAAGLQNILSVLILMTNGIILATVILFLEKLHFKYKQRSCRMTASLLRTTRKASHLKIRRQRKIFAVHFE
uniref:Ionotropic receptor 1 n=1 Tax=Sirex noctilio TaxID=36765 RepID=A0A857N3P6_9HYME|nr:ionotropic receptor 1 [Sirex noctilio]